MEISNQYCWLIIAPEGQSDDSQGCKKPKATETPGVRQKTIVAPEGQSNAALVIGSQNGGFAVALSGLFIAGQSCFPPGQARGS